LVANPTTVETMGTRKNMKSMSFRASSRFDLSRGWAEMVAGGRRSPSGGCRAADSNGGSGNSSPEKTVARAHARAAEEEAGKVKKVHLKLI